VSKVNQFIDIMRTLGAIEICRTGITAMNRGSEGIW
jgi:acetolactate synthase-1/3 small subunit